MNLIAVIAVDLETAPLGQGSYLGYDLCGMSVLRRTAQRVLRAAAPTATYVLVPQAQRAAAACMLTGLELRYCAHDFARPAHAAMVAAGRIWGMDGWRGGIGGLCAFDEDVNVPALAELCHKAGADGVICVPGHAALIDPGLIDAMAEHHKGVAAQMRLTFTTAAPGLAPVILSGDLLDELAPTGQPPGAILTYRPGQPVMDLAGREPCYRPPAVVSELRARLIADTARGFLRVLALYEAGADDWSAERIATHWSNAADEIRLHSDFEEIELELTTADPLSDRTLLRPRGAAVPRRGPISPQHVQAVARSFFRTDDMRLVLGGFGDPLEHPQFAELLTLLRGSRAAAIAVRTTGLAGDESLDQALFDAPVDVIAVTLDSATAEGYRRVHGVDGFDRVVARIERWMQMRAERKQVRPLIVPEFIKCTHTLGEMEAFFDHWMRRCGWASIAGYSHCARQRADLAVTPIAPPRRTPCRRLWTRAMVLADGNVVTCDQDFAGRSAMGILEDAAVSDFWEGPALTALRNAHREGRYDGHPLCPACDEWHRP